MILHSALPKAEERFTWSMPTYWKKYSFIHFAATKKHIGSYPGIDAVLIEKIAKWCLETGKHA